MIHPAMAPSQEQEAAASPRLSVLESLLVAPSLPAPEKASLPLTFFDVFWLNHPPVERVFFYRLAPSGTDDTTSIISNLKTSLSRALHAFYPLAGRLRLTPGTADRYEIHYQPGDGVSFTVAEYDADVDHLAADEPREVARILPLVPLLADGGALLAVQATVLRGGRGLAVGLTLHHAACDGASSTRFLHTWAAAGTGAAAPPPPVIDRTLVNDPSGGCTVHKWLTTDETERVKMAGDKLVATFTLSKEDIQRVKDAVATAGAGAVPPRCSSLVSTFSFIWWCYQRTKHDAASNSDPTYFVFPVDQRARMKPDTVPDEYFGNCIGAAMHAAPMDRLAAAGADGLLVACTAVAAAVDRAAGELGSPEMMETWRGWLREAAASRGGLLSVAGSPRFRVYQVDFGFGRPAKVEIVSVARTGAMAVAESRGSGGGIEVGMSLPPVTMRRFKNCFNDAIMWLRQQ